MNTEIEQYLVALADSMEKEIVLCDMNHTIQYMNQYAKDHYTPRFGEDLIGKNLLDCHNEHSAMIIRSTIQKAVADGVDSVQITDKPNKNRKSYITMLKDKSGSYIGYYERYEGNAF